MASENWTRRQLNRLTKRYFFLHEVQVRQGKRIDKNHPIETGNVLIEAGFTKLDLACTSLSYTINNSVQIYCLYFQTALYIRRKCHLQTGIPLFLACKVCCNHLLAI